MRLQRMLFRLQQYDLRVTYAKGTELYIADMLIRAYQPSDSNDTLEEDLKVHVILLISNAKLRELQEETQNDPDLQKLKSVIQGSWPQRKSHLSPSIQNYWDSENSSPFTTNLSSNKIKLLFQQHYEKKC